MEFNKMTHNWVERIEFVIFNGMDNIPRRKKIVIYRDGRFIVRCYRPNETQPCIKKEFITTHLAVEILFRKLQFLSRHVNVNLRIHDTSGSELKICYKLGNSESIGRNAFGLFVPEWNIVKVITAETLIDSFLMKYGDGTSLRDWTDCES